MSYNFLELQKACSGKNTFVITNRKELHATVRKFIVDSVAAYHESGSHALDGKTGLRVGIDFNRSYGPYVRSAMSKASDKVVWSYDSSGVVSYKPLSESRKKDTLKDIQADLKVALDKIDADEARPPLSKEDKADRAAKSLLSTLANAPAEKVQHGLKFLDDMEAEALQALYANLDLMKTAIDAKLNLKAVA